MNRVIIQHLSSNGNLHNKHLNAVSVHFDYGYEYPQGIVNPAVKIITDTGQYHLLGCERPERIVKLLSDKCLRQKEVVVPYKVFDWGESVEINMSLNQWYHWAPKNIWINTDATKVFTKKEQYLLMNGNFTPILNVNCSKLKHLWAQTMPVPKIFVKYEFFQKVITDGARRDEALFS